MQSKQLEHKTENFSDTIQNLVEIVEVMIIENTPHKLAIFSKKPANIASLEKTLGNLAKSKENKSCIQNFLFETFKLCSTQQNLKGESIKKLKEIFPRLNFLLALQNDQDKLSAEQIYTIVKYPINDLFAQLVKQKELEMKEFYELASNRLIVEKLSQFEESIVAPIIAAQKRLGLFNMANLEMTLNAIPNCRHHENINSTFSYIIRAVNKKTQDEVQKYFKRIMQHPTPDRVTNILYGSYLSKFINSAEGMQYHDEILEIKDLGFISELQFIGDKISNISLADFQLFLKHKNIFADFEIVYAFSALTSNDLNLDKHMHRIINFCNSSKNAKEIKEDIFSYIKNLHPTYFEIHPDWQRPNESTTYYQYYEDFFNRIRNQFNQGLQERKNEVHDSNLVATRRCAR